MLSLWRTRVLLLLLLCLASQRSDGALRKRKKRNRVETRRMDCSWNCSQQGLPCRVKKDCNWWCNAFNATHCPETPSKPVLRGTEPFVFQSGNGTYHLGLNVTWEPPDDGSIVFVRGFQVRVMSENAKDFGWKDCVTLNITGTKMSMVDPKRLFYYNCFGNDLDESPKRFVPGQKYRLVLYSKPQQGEGHTDQNVSRTFRMPDCDTPGMDVVEDCKTVKPDDWVPAYINFSVNGSTVNVTFDPAPSTFTFDGYFVWLEPAEAGHGVEMKQETLVNNVLFHDVQEGKYNVRLRLKKRDCDCTDSVSDRSFSVQGQTTTPEPTPTPPPTTPAPPTEITSTTGTIGPTRADSTRMLVAIVGGLAGVLVAGVLLFLMWRRSKLPEDSCHLQGDDVPYRTFNNGLQQEGSTVPLLMDTEQRDSFSAAPETMNNFSVRPVLLIYSHDHPLHEATVRAFAAFLRQQCGCDVTLDDYCMQSIQRRGKIPWLCRQIERAERVIVVCSKGTKRIWEDIVKAEPSVLSPYAPPCGDMVRPAIHLITAEFHGHSTFEKYITAYFSYSSEEDVPRALNVGNNYILMKHFEELYIHLLRWNRRPARPDFALPELGEDQYHQSEAGGKLKRCIDEMTAFQADHPTWFQDSQGSSQACGGGDDTGLQPHYSSTPGDVPDSHGGQQHTSNHFVRPHHASQSQSRRDNNYDYEMSPESSDSPCIVSTPDKTELDVHCNGPSRAQPMTGQSRDAVRPDISGPGGRRPDATYTYSLPVMNTVDTLLIPNGHANRRTAPTRAVGGPQSIESEGTSDYSVPNRTVPNLVISPSVALLARHVEQFQATQGGASEDEGIDTLASRDRMTDV